MEKLNELVELAKSATPGPWKWATDWERAAVYSISADAYPENKRVVCSGNQNNHKRFNAEPCSGSDWNDAAFIAAANPETILAIAEAFRALAQRAEAAEAKLAELERQDPIGWVVVTGNGNHLFRTKRPRLRVTNEKPYPVFPRAAPAINLAELVPDNIPKDVYEVIYQECGGFVDCSANAQTIWKACRAAIMLKIEKRGADMLAAPEVE